jgi:hypothetical protein
MGIEGHFIGIEGRFMGIEGKMMIGPHFVLFFFLSYVFVLLRKGSQMGEFAFGR